MRNLSAKPVIIPANTTIVSVSAANIIPPMLAPKNQNYLGKLRGGTDVKKGKLTEKKMEKLFSKLYLSGLDDWDQALQK